MKKLIIGNWKANPRTWGQAANLFFNVSKAASRARAEVVVCPPFPHLSHIAYHLSRLGKSVKLGAQDVFWGEEGPYTGEVPASLLKTLGVRYVIVGHSERRQLLGETDSMVAKKVKAALASGLKVILCVGEPLSVRRKGASAARRFVAGQLKKGLSLIKNSKSKNSLVVAYEPVWAISTSAHHRDETPEDAAEMISYIKGVLRSNLRIKDPKVLYGGSVDGKTAGGFLEHREIDGLLVGGASLRAGEFGRIIRTAENA